MRRVNAEREGTMKTVVIGGVAAGTKTAAKLKREDRNSEVVIYTAGKDISYAGCGLPYYVGGEIESREELVVNTPEAFESLTGVKVFTQHKLTSIQPDEKTVKVTDLTNDSELTVKYDNLVLATGANPFVPPTEGAENKGVFTVRTPDDAVSIRDYVKNTQAKKAVVAGAGFIGLEMAENLFRLGLSVTVLDMADQLLVNILDYEMADYVRRHYAGLGINVVLGAKVEKILGSGQVSGVKTDVGEFSAEIVILAVGVKPETSYTVGSGIATEKGLIITDEYQRTNVKDIYAVGDCAMVKNRITGKPQWSAMGSTANIVGRSLAKNISGKSRSYPGVLGTAVIKLSKDLSAGRTGLTEKQAVDAGLKPITVVCVCDDKAHYYPDSSFFIIKLIAEADTGKLLGIQVLGKGEVDKVTDIAVTGISAGLTVHDFDYMDFSYAPPFSTAIHPFTAACYILENKMSGEFVTVTPAEYAAGKANGFKVVDVTKAATIPGAFSVDLGNAEEAKEKFSLTDKLLLVCTRGKRAYFLQNKLKNLGFENTYVLEGGLTFNKVKVKRAGEKLSPEEIKRVKGLGCLQDKRYDDVFNVRVITRNGKITAQEHRIIAEAAEKYGSGSVTMTTRLTLEIQGVKYDNIEELIEFLKSKGLDTGGTGSLVRPVVSCKGTTCQYGLLDSFGLSEKLHTKFYEGYHGVTLPHKFKIAVGGCPNNCVKPNLNDLGIVGQRIPVIDYAKCRGCKVCQIEKACPIKLAKVVDGKIYIDPNECNHCGRCVSKCPFGAFEEYRDGYKIFIGGRWGKKVAMGKPLSRILTSEEEVIDMVERALLFYRSEGITGERFADTIDRLGFDYVESKLLSADFDKKAALEKNVKGGASC